MITIELPEAVERHFTELASKAGKTTSALALDALLEKIEDLEDYFEAEEIMRNSKPGDFISLEELDELSAIKAYDAAKAANEEEIPFEIAIKEIERQR